MEYFYIMFLGISAGLFSGFFGLGGAVILVPALVYIFRFSQHCAQGTALAALLLPVGILAVIKYYQAGNVNVRTALFISLGFFVGGLAGAIFAHMVPTPILKRLFGGLLLVISIIMLIGK